MVKQLLITMEGDENDLEEAQDSITETCWQIEWKTDWDSGGQVEVDMDFGEGYRWK